MKEVSENDNSEKEDVKKNRKSQQTEINKDSSGEKEAGNGQI